MEYHTVYKRPEGETTQWEDLQRKFGNLPPKEPVHKPEAFVPAQDKSKDRQLLDNDDDIEALENAEDDFADDPFLEAYRCAPLGSHENVYNKNVVRMQQGAAATLLQPSLLRRVFVASGHVSGTCVQHMHAGRSD